MLAFALLLLIPYAAMKLIAGTARRSIAQLRCSARSTACSASASARSRARSSSVMAFSVLVLGYDTIWGLHGPPDLDHQGAHLSACRCQLREAWCQLIARAPRSELRKQGSRRPSGSRSNERRRDQLYTPELLALTTRLPNYPLERYSAAARRGALEQLRQHDRAGHRARSRRPDRAASACACSACAVGQAAAAIFARRRSGAIWPRLPQALAAHRPRGWPARAAMPDWPGLGC